MCHKNKKTISHKKRMIVGFENKRNHKSTGHIMKKVTVKMCEDCHKWYKRIENLKIGRFKNGYIYNDNGKRS